MNKLKNIVEWHIFGVCSSIGERLGIASSRIRMWFIYFSFITMGSPLILYMILSFIKNIKNYIKQSKRNPVFWQ